MKLHETAAPDERAETELLTPRQAAVVLKASQGTLRRWRTIGSGPVYVLLSPRMVRYSRVELERWCAARQRTSTAAA